MHANKTWMKRVLFGSITLSCLLLALICLPSLAEAQLPLPPRPPSRPTPTSNPTPLPAPPPVPEDGAAIQLLVHPDEPQNWREPGPWRDIFSTVQWQGETGEWHDVLGWRGPMDIFWSGGAIKTWWLSRDLYGRGPFRWVIYREFEGPVLAISESFSLPTVDGALKQIDVEVHLTP